MELAIWAYMVLWALEIACLYSSVYYTKTSANSLCKLLKLVHLGQLVGWKWVKRLIGLLKKLVNYKYNQQHKNEFSIMNF